MAMPPKYILCVYIATDVAVKVTLNERSTSVDELIGILKDKVKPRLDFEFTLQYDPTCPLPPSVNGRGKAWLTDSRE